MKQKPPEQEEQLAEEPKQEPELKGQLLALDTI